MTRALIVVLFTTSLWAGDLKITNLRLMESEHGLPKREATYVPGENLVLNFDMVGLKRDGVTMTFKLTFELVDPTGEVASRWQSEETRVTDLFGGSAQPGSVWYEFPGEAMRGTYTAKLSVEDVATREVAEASVPVTLAEPELSIVNLGLTADPNGQQPCGRVRVEREVVWVDFSVAGLRQVDKKARFQQDLVLLDEDGSVVGWHPNAVDAEVTMRGPVTAVQNRLALTRTGKYHVKVVVRDLNADGSKTEHVVPIEVVPSPK